MAVKLAIIMNVLTLKSVMYSQHDCINKNVSEQKRPVSLSRIKVIINNNRHRPTHTRKRTNNQLLLLFIIFKFQTIFNNFLRYVYVVC